MSIYDRDFSKIDAKAVVAGSVVQAKNVLQAALDEIAALRAENAQLRDLLHQGRAYVWSFAHTNAEDMRARMVLGDIDDALKSSEILAEPQK